MIKIQGDIYWFTLGAKGDRTLDTATTDCCSISILPHCSVTIPKGNKIVSDHAKPAAKAIRKKIKPYSSSHLPLSTVSTASELIKAHLQSASTKKNYSSALTTRGPGRSDGFGSSGQMDLQPQIQIGSS